MSSSGPGPRPRQVTIGGWVVAVASAMLVVSVFDTMTNLHSVDTRDALTRALTTGSGRDLGITVGNALTLMRWALFVAGAAAAVTGVLGIFVLQRHTRARIVLTVAAVPVVLTAPVVDVFLGALVGGATALLWTRPARDWFAGRPPAPVPPRQPAETRRPVPTAWQQPPAWQPPVQPPVSPPVQPPGQEAGHPGPPAPMHGWGRPVAAPVPSWPPPYAVAAPARTGSGRPASVQIACILTWIFTTLTGLGYLVLGLAVAVDRQGTLDLLARNSSIRDSSLTEDELVGVVLGISALIVVWCLAAALLALFAWHRHEWARVLLLVSVGVAAAVEVPGLPYSFLHVAAGLTAFVLLLRPATRAWFRGSDSPGRPDEPTRPTPPAGGASGWQPPPGWQPPSSPPPERPREKPPVW
jgi:hypothetical protein